MSGDTGMTPFRIGPGAWFFLALWLALMAGGRERLFRDPGTFWHVRVGERVLDTGVLVRTDPYTFTFGGTPWTPHGWLGEVGMAALHRLAGIDALLLASAVLVAGTFALPFVRLVRCGLHWSVAACLVGLAVAAAASHFHARPHLVTLAFFALLFARLADFDTGRVRLTGLFWLLPLFAVWANVHGGVVGGYGTVGLAAAGWIAFRLIGWPTAARSASDAVKLIAWAGAVGLTALATPYGLEMPRAWLDIVGMGELPGIIKEHARVEPTEPSSWPFFALGAVYAAAMAGLREKPRVAWLLPVVWFLLGCDRVRNAPLFAAAAVIALADVFPRTVWAHRLANRPDLYHPPVETDLPRRNPTLVPNLRFGTGSCEPPVRASHVRGVANQRLARGHPEPEVRDECESDRVGFRLSGGAALCCAAVLFSFALQIGGVRVPVVGAGWAAFPESEWPISLVPALHREAGGHTGIPAFNEYEFGGFLIYFAPEYRPFVDDRCEVFGGPWLAAFVAANADPAPAISRWEAEYGRFAVALTRPGSGYDGYFAANPEWEKVASAPAGNLYRRR